MSNIKSITENDVEKKVYLILKNRDDLLEKYKEEKIDNKANQIYIQELEMEIKRLDEELNMMNKKNGGTNESLLKIINENIMKSVGITESDVEKKIQEKRKKFEKERKLNLKKISEI